MCAPSQTGEILRRLGGYVDAHFENEELLMAQSGYPGLADHRLEVHIRRCVGTSGVWETW